jgi:uncharacterized protein with FMN-binding domain
MSQDVSRRTFVAAAAGTAAMVAAGSQIAKATEAASAAQDLTGAQDGTYTAEGQGIGTVTATLTIKDGAITDCTLDLAGETVFMGQQLVEPLQQAVVDAQGSGIDTVAGCTLTCYGVIDAVSACIAQAKGEKPVDAGVGSWDDQTAEDWLGTEPAIAEDQITETIDTDILIVGAGNAGMAGAAFAAKQGLDFRVFESAPSVQDVRGWFGAVDTVAAQAQGAEKMDRRKLLSEISRYASGKVNQKVVKLWIDESSDMYDFVASILENDPYDCEVTVTTGDEARWPDSCNEENTVYFFPEMEHFYGFTDKTRNVMFQEVVEAAGVSIDFNTSLVKLEKDASGRVTGVIAQNTRDGHYVRANAAKGVLLACGGYDGNPWMMEALDPLSASTVTCTNASPRDRGMGIRAAIWAGAKLQDEPASMLFDRGLVENGIDAGYADNPKAFAGKEFPGTLKQYNPGTQPFLKVNRRGERFMNESQPYNDAPYAASKQPGHVYCVVCDGNVQADVERFHTIGCSAGTRKMGFDKAAGDYIESGLVKTADTLDELADKLGFSGEAKETFLATCDRYNELFDAQYDEDFGKPSVRLSELRTAPFYGWWQGSSLLCTMQGIEINEKTQAVDAESNPIEGLYVAGNNAGDMFSGNYPCLMPGLRCGSAMTQAIKAVKVMAGIDA